MKKIIIITTVPQSLNFFKGQIQILKKEFNVALVSTPNDLFREICFRESVPGYGVKICRDISVFKDFFSLINLIRVFVKFNPDVIHGNTPKAGLLSMFAGWLLRIPIRIYYVHGLRYEGLSGLKKNIVVLMEKLTCFCATDIISVSQGVRETLERDSITSKSVSLIGCGSINGLNFDHFNRNSDLINIREKLGISTDTFVFGFVGRIVKDKGIEELISSFTTLLKEKKIALILVGAFENKLDPIAPSFVRIINDNPDIYAVGKQMDIRPFLKAMDMFVLPSYREGFGVSLIEALAMEIPCIATDISGCNEIIVDEFNGLLVPPKSIKALSIAMLRCVNDESLYTSIKINSRNSVIDKYRQDFVWQNSLKKYIEITRD